MPSFNEISKIANELHDKKLINLDTPIRELLKPQGIGDVDPTGPISDNVLAWSDYILITSGKTTSVDELAKVTELIRPINR